MKTNIKLRVTPKQSIAVQKICFANDIDWNSEENKISYTVTKYLFIEPTGVWFREIANHDSGMETVGYNEVDADLFIRTNGTCVEPEETTIEATIEECKFEKYGFEKPDFECEILKEYNNHLVGAVYQNEKYFGTSWNKQGTCLQTKGFGYINMDLTPIKKPWYETCKFPVLVWDDDNDLFVIRTRGEYTALYLNACNPLTNDEIEELKQ